MRYSIVKNIKTRDGREQVIPVSELINMLCGEEEKASLLDDCISIASLFTTDGTLSINEIREYWTLYQNEHKA